MTATTTTQTHYERAEEISAELLAAVARGESVASLAKHYDLRREAIAAELAKHGIGDPSPAREAVLAYVREHPGLSIDDLSLRLDLSKSSVSRYLRGAEEHKLVVSRKTSPIVKFTDADMTAAMKYAFTQLDDRSKGLSRKRYKEILEASGRDYPAAPTQIRRYGSWSEACKRAGVTASKARRSNYVREFSDEDILDAVAEFMATGGSSYHRYAEWAKEHGRASGPLLVQRLGGWANAKRAVVQRPTVAA